MTKMKANSHVNKTKKETQKHFLRKRSWLIGSYSRTACKHGRETGLNAVA